MNKKITNAKLYKFLQIDKRKMEKSAPKFIESKIRMAFRTWLNTSKLILIHPLPLGKQKCYMKIYIATSRHYKT